MMPTLRRAARVATLALAVATALTAPAATARRTPTAVRGNGVADTVVASLPGTVREGGGSAGGGKRSGQRGALAHGRQ
jgi:hypothetical protein